MIIAKVVGRTWATQKSPGLIGKKLLLIQTISGNPPKPSGEILMAVADQIDAGMGDTVLAMDEGGSARSILNDNTVPVRLIIVGIMDTMTFTELSDAAELAGKERSTP